MVADHSKNVLPVIESRAQKKHLYNNNTQRFWENRSRMCGKIKQKQLTYVVSFSILTHISQKRFVDVEFT